MDNPRLPEHLRPVSEKKLQKEIDAGRSLGPFDDAPFPNLRVSPIKVAPNRRRPRGSLDSFITSPIRMMMRR